MGKKIKNTESYKENLLRNRYEKHFYKVEKPLSGKCYDLEKLAAEKDVDNNFLNKIKSIESKKENLLKVKNEHEKMFCENQQALIEKGSHGIRNNVEKDVNVLMVTWFNSVKGEKWGKTGELREETQSDSSVRVQLE